MTIGLERELVELGDGLDVPDAPDLAAMVTARLRTAQPAVGRSGGFGCLRLHQSELACKCPDFLG